MKRPFLPVVIWFASGILVSAILNPPWWLAGGLAWIFSAIILCHPNSRSRGLPALLLASGCAWHALQSDIISPVDLRTVVGPDPVLAQMEGTLAAPIQERLTRHGDIETSTTTAVVRARRLRLDGETWQSVHGRIAVTVSGPLNAPYHAGQSVIIDGILMAPPPPIASGLFDYRNHLAQKGIHHQLKVESSADWTSNGESFDAGGRGWQERFTTWARGTLARGLPEEDESLRLLWAMTLGWKLGLTDEVTEPFMKSGTMHVFAISGLHVALMAGCLLGLLRLLKIPRAYCGLIVIPWLWFYSGATGWPASAIRSSAMMSVVIAGWSLHRPGDLLNSLAGAALLVLMWDPLQLFQAGFQLSFSVVLSLALFGPFLDTMRQRLLRPDPFLPDELRPRWKKVLAKPLHYVSASFATSLAAWLGSVPLAAYYFHYFTPVSLLANVAILPLSGLALTSCLASLLTSDWMPPVGELFNHSAWFWMRLMVTTSERAADLPGAWCHVAAPSAVLLILYYGVLVSLLSGWLRHPVRRRCIVSGVICLTALWSASWYHQRHETSLTVLPVGGGDAIVYRSTRGDGIQLVDMGNESSARFLTRPFLQSRGVNTIAHVVLSHGDVRHVGGLDEILQQFNVKNVDASPIDFRSRVYKRWIDELHEDGRLQRVSDGSRLGDWRILHPTVDSHHPQADDNALVLYTASDGVAILLLSDLGFPGQDELLNRYPHLSADIVITGLPTQSEPVAEGLLHAVNPSVVLVNDASNPAGQRAGVELRARLERHLGARQIFYTSDVGGITVRCRDGSYAIVSGSNEETIFVSAKIQH